MTDLEVVQPRQNLTQVEAGVVFRPDHSKQVQGPQLRNMEELAVMHRVQSHQLPKRKALQARCPCKQQTVRANAKEKRPVYFG